MWNGASQIGGPNWAGDNTVVSDVGNLYILPNPPTIEENPSIGLEGRNEVPLPTKYKDLDVKNLTAENFNGVPVDLSKWSEFPAIHDVTAIRDEVTTLRKYAIKDFIEVEAGNIYAKQENIPFPNGGSVNADVSVSAPTGTFSNLFANGSLYVTGGTTLDGGYVNGTSIGSLPVSGINTVRIDVLPIGIDIVSPTYVTIDTVANANMLAGGAVEITAAGAVSVAAGGAVSIAGGSYIEYNTDQNYFRNTSAGNDYTDIYVGNIHPADGGTDNLRINGGGSGRYVRVDDGLMIQSKAHKASQFDYLVGHYYKTTTVYVPDDEVDFQARSYKCLVENSGFLPTQTVFTPWDDITPYVVGNLVQQLLLVFRCIADITGGDPPVGNPTNWVEVGNVVTLPPIWQFIENFEDNQYSFKVESGDTYGWSLIKKKGQEGVRIMRNVLGPNTDFTIGRLYDDTFNTLTTANIPVTGDLNLMPYNVISQKSKVSQLDTQTTWSDATTYVPGETVIAGTNKVYRCKLENLNLDPTATSIPLWDSGGITYLAGNIVTLADTSIYRCILGYTTTGGDTPPDGDTTHWLMIFPAVTPPPPTWNYEQYFPGDYAIDPFTGLTYKCTVTTVGLNPLIYPTKTSIMTINIGDRIKWYYNIPGGYYNFIAYEALASGTGGSLGDPPNANYLNLETALPPYLAVGNWELGDPPPPGVSSFWEYQRDVLNGGVEFQALPYDTDYYTLVKPAESTGLWISERDAETNALNRLGQIYDTAINPATIGNLPVSGNLQMNGYSVLGALNIQPSQYDITPNWADSSLYYVDDFVIVGSNKIYKCLSDNLNLYPLSTIQYWGLDGVVYSEGNITTIGGGYNYICILGYTSASGDPSPNSDPTHWALTTGGDITAFWELFGDAVQGGLVYQPTPSDATYMTLIKPQGLNTLAIFEKAVGTNAFVNAGVVYDTTFNPAFIGGISSLPVGGSLDMQTYNITNVGDFQANSIGAVPGGVGYVSIIDQLQGSGKSLQNFNYLELKGPATGDNATIELKNTGGSIGLSMMVDADTGEANISANFGVPLTITTNDRLYLTGGEIIANTLTMTGNINLASNDIVACNNLTTNSINMVGNLFRRGQFGNFQDQTFTSSTTAEQQVIVNSVMGTVNGITLNTSTWEITVDADGFYKVDFLYQLTSSSGAHTHSFFWTKRNGVAMVQSTSQMTIRNSEVDCLTFTRIFELSSGDKLTFWWNSSNNNDRLYTTAAITTPFVRPAQPSVVIAITSC